MDGKLRPPVPCEGVLNKKGIKINGNIPSTTFSIELHSSRQQYDHSIYQTNIDYFG